MSDNSTPRRDFIGTLAASAITFAGVACAAPAAAIQTATAPATGASRAGNTRPVAPTRWDNSWFDRLTAKHKAVFDTSEIVENTVGGPGQAVRYINGVHEALEASYSDVQTVVVIRHKAIPFIFNDAMWAKYNIAELSIVKTESGAWATKNDIATGSSRASGDDKPQANIPWLTTHGHVVLGCNLATMAFTSRIASKTKGDSSAIYEELKANLVPGVVLQPNGIYAVLRAQEAGCAFMRAS
jgi:intracellular sulfur oxidation DsrE/DsrF family protein